MSEENKIGTYQFVAEPFHVDLSLIHISEPTDYAASRMPSSA